MTLLLLHKKEVTGETGDKEEKAKGWRKGEQYTANQKRDEAIEHHAFSAKDTLAPAHGIPGDALGLAFAGLFQIFAAIPPECDREQRSY